MWHAESAREPDPKSNSRECFSHPDLETCYQKNKRVFVGFKVPIICDWWYYYYYFRPLLRAQGGRLAGCFHFSWSQVCLDFHSKAGEDTSLQPCRPEQSQAKQGAEGESYGWETVFCLPHCTEEKWPGRGILSKAGDCSILVEISLGFWQRFMENSGH